MWVALSNHLEKTPHLDPLLVGKFGTPLIATNSKSRHDRTEADEFTSSKNTCVCL
jgi:hypothetical protein